MKLVALAAVAALALQADAKPVVGGGSFNAAPILEPGRYRDTILAGEYLYYGIRLGAGQRLTVTADTELSDSELAQRDVNSITGNVHSPSRGIDISKEQGPNHSIPNSAHAPIQMQSPQVAEIEDAATDGVWAGPGVYYVGFHAVPSDVQPQRAEIPLEFELRVDGTERQVATVTPSPTPPPATTATPAPTPEEDEPGPEPSVAAAFGLGGLLIGVILAIVRRRQRR